MGTKIFRAGDIDSVIEGGDDGGVSGVWRELAFLDRIRCDAGDEDSDLLGVGVSLPVLGHESKVQRLDTLAQIKHPAERHDQYTHGGGGEHRIGVEIVLVLNHKGLDVPGPLLEGVLVALEPEQLDDRLLRVRGTNQPLNTAPGPLPKTGGGVKIVLPRGGILGHVCTTHLV